MDRHDLHVIAGYGAIDISKTVKTPINTMAKKLFAPGNPGRPKGSQNKYATREHLRKILEDPAAWEKYSRELMSLKGRAFTDQFSRLWEYDTPKFQSMHLSLANMPEADLRFLLTKLKEHGTEDLSD